MGSPQPHQLRLGGERGKGEFAEEEKKGGELFKNIILLEWKFFFLLHISTV